MMVEGGKYELRPVGTEDIHLLWEWANDPKVRTNSFQTEQIPFEEHRKWFAKLLTDAFQKQYIFIEDAQPIGQIRFTIFEEEAEISYSISPEKRGLGYGTMMLNIAKIRFHQDCPDIKRLIGYVKPENHSSGRCFEKSGFKEDNGRFEFSYKE